jgi:hypothetical protein
MNWASANLTNYVFGQPVDFQMSSFLNDLGEGFLRVCIVEELLLKLWGLVRQVGETFAQGTLKEFIKMSLLFVF